MPGRFPSSKALGRGPQSHRLSALIQSMPNKKPLVYYFLIYYMNILEEDFPPLSDLEFITDYTNQCMNEETILHLTFTLNPLMNKADMLTQYRSMIREIKNSRVFYYKSKHEFQIHPGFRKLMLIPELTKTVNIHLHGILIIDKPYISYFINELKRLCWNNTILGRQMSANLVNDTYKDRTTVAAYAFKDIEQLMKFPDSKKMGFRRFTRK